ncbi:MAG: hypothetical protein ABI557_09565 [Aureliella sp.]
MISLASELLTCIPIELTPGSCSFKLADELRANEDELLLLADKVPASIRERIQQRPALFRKIAAMDSQSLDALERTLSDKQR